MKKEITYAGGVSLGTALTTAFMILKLTHVINWPWVWVLSPMWITLAIYIVTIPIVLIFWARAVDKEMEQREKEFKDRWRKQERR